jgi:hypothetical protein
MRLHRLTAVRVQQIRKPGFYPDGGGLYLQVTEGAPNPDDPDKAVTVNKCGCSDFPSRTPASLASALRDGWGSDRLAP